MNTQNEKQIIKISCADPSALGLFGLAITTLVASSQKLGITTGFSFVIPWAIFLGSLAQLIACFNDAKNENTFGATAFGAFAFFWLALATSWLFKMGVFGKQLAVVDGKQLGFAFLAYLIFCVYMTIGAMETHKVLFMDFVFIDFLFIGLTLSSFNIGGEATLKLAAYSELAISIISFYGSAASVLNNHFGRVFLPVGKPFGIFKNSNFEQVDKNVSR